MATLLSAAQSALLATLINESAQAPQNQLDATLVDKMAPLAVVTGFAATTGWFKDQAEERPLGLILDWAQNGHYMIDQSAPSTIAEHQLIVDEFDDAPNFPLDATIAERLLPIMEITGFIENNVLSLDTLKNYPVSALLAWMWWLNVPDVTLPFPWCVVEA